jgi:hypothetical protein
VFDKYKARAVKREISRVLWEVWDPIGVKPLGGPRDEYASYVNGVYELVVSGADDELLAEHLLRIARETMGLSGATRASLHPTITGLRAIKLPARLVEPTPPNS